MGNQPACGEHRKGLGLSGVKFQSRRPAKDHRHHTVLARDGTHRAGVAVDQHGIPPSTRTIGPYQLIRPVSATHRLL